MAAAPSYSDLYDIGRAELQLRRPDLFAEPGDITDLVIAEGAAMGDKNVGYATARFAELWLDTAKGDDLTALADDRYGIVRQAATFAIGTLTFNRATAAAGAGAIPAGTVVATLRDQLGNEVRVATDAEVSYGGAETGDKQVAATAEVAGPGGNVAAGTLTRIVDTLFDASITVTNAARFAGGAAEESDEALRERVRTFPLTLRRGTLAALEYGARSVAGVATAKAYEDAAGLVTLYIADDSGNANAELVAAVATELENWRAAGAVVSVQAGEVFEQDVSFTLTVKAGTDVAAQISTIQAAVSSRMAKLVPGETLYLDSLRAAIVAVNPDRFLGVTFAAPLANVVPEPSQVIRAGSITVA